MCIAHTREVNYKSMKYEKTRKNPTLQYFNVYVAFF